MQSFSLGVGQEGFTFSQKASRSVRKAFLEKFAVDASNAEDIGVTDGELLEALAKHRATFSPFGAFCRFWGTAMNLIGVVPCVAISFISLVYTIRAAAAGAFSLGQKAIAFARKIFSFFNPGLAAVAEATTAVVTKDERIAYDESSYDPTALLGLIEMAIPAPFRLALNALLPEAAPSAGQDSQSLRDTVSELVDRRMDENIGHRSRLEDQEEPEDDQP